MELQGLKATGSRWNHALVVLLLLAVAGMGGFFLLGAMANASNAAARVRCQKTLRELYPLIVQFVESHGQFPVDDTGHFAVSVLADDNDEARQVLMSLEKHGEDLNSSLLSGTNVALDANGRLDTSSRQIVLCDRPGNHLRRLGNGLLERVGGVVQEDAQLLLADGSVITWTGDTTAYANWAKRFAAGSGEPYPPGIEEQLTD